MNVKLSGVSLFWFASNRGVSLFWFASNRSEPGFSCKCYNLRMAPEGVSSAKGPIVIGSPWLARCSRYYLRHDDAKWPDLRSAKDEYAPNHRSSETQNQVGGDDVGGELDCAHSRFRRWSRPRRRPHS